MVQDPFYLKLVPICETLNPNEERESPLSFPFLFFAFRFKAWPNFQIHDGLRMRRDSSTKENSNHLCIPVVSYQESMEYWSKHKLQYQWGLS